MLTFHLNPARRCRARADLPLELSTASPLSKIEYIIKYVIYTEPENILLTFNNVEGHSQQGVCPVPTRLPLQPRASMGISTRKYALLRVYGVSFRPYPT